MPGLPNVKKLLPVSKTQSVGQFKGSYANALSIFAQINSVLMDSAKKGDLGSLALLAKKYFAGDGVEENMENAYALATLALDGLIGNDIQNLDNASLYLMDIKHRAERTLNDKDLLAIQDRLDRYRKDSGQEKNLPLPIHVLPRDLRMQMVNSIPGAAAMGDARARALYAFMYKFGEGVQKDNFNAYLILSVLEKDNAGLTEEEFKTSMYFKDEVKERLSKYDVVRAEWLAERYQTGQKLPVTRLSQFTLAAQDLMRQTKRMVIPTSARQGKPKGFVI